MNSKILRSALLFAVLLAAGLPPDSVRAARPQPRVVVIRLDMMIHQVSADYVVRGIRYASEENADAVLLELNTPGGLMTSMREIIQAIFDSRVPVITYVAPSGGSAASAGFFILLSGDLAVMAPGTNTGAAHPVVLGGTDVGKTMEEKLENDAAAYIRSIAQKRGRNVVLAEEAVRKSSSFTDKEALDDKLIDAVASSPSEIFAKCDGKAIQRFNDTTTTLHLANAVVEPYPMPRLEAFLAWVADPNIAFILGALGVACLYIEFTHPGMVAPGVVGAISLVLALYAFNLLPINYAGALLILTALVLFALEAKLTSHGVLAAGGIVAMVLGALILVKSPWPEARIHLSTALSVALPLGFITIILVRFAVAAKLRKVVTGEQGMIGALGVAQTDLAPGGKIWIHGELWEARAAERISQGTRVRVREMEGLTLVVEPVPKSR
ncbi:MAG: nodulation protein NfeD [Terriglobia bacterium]